MLDYKIVTAEHSHINQIRSLANEIWQYTYKNIISQNQIDYMLEYFYGMEGLEKQFYEKSEQFYLAQINSKFVGYASCSAIPESPILILNKLYILQSQQRQGCATVLLNKIIEVAKENKKNAIQLNVNKHNTNAAAFYNKKNFVVVREEIRDIGNGYVMDDFILELQIDVKTK